MVTGIFNTRPRTATRNGGNGVNVSNNYGGDIVIYDRWAGRRLITVNIPRIPFTGVPPIETVSKGTAAIIMLNKGGGTGDPLPALWCDKCGKQYPNTTAGCPHEVHYEDKTKRRYD